MQKINNTDLNKNKPGKPPTSADFSKIDQERSINGRLLMKRKYNTGKAKTSVPKKSIKALKSKKYKAWRGPNDQVTDYVLPESFHVDHHEKAMKKLKEQLKLAKKFLRNALEVAVPFLCLGVVVQLIVGESLFGWNPIKNIQNAINSIGQSNFIGIATLLVLYSVFKKQ